MLQAADPALRWAKIERGFNDFAGEELTMLEDVYTSEAEFDLSGSETGWGFNLSSNLLFGPNGSKLKGSILYGEGVENYMNDATTDLAVVEDFDNPTSPLTAKLLPITALVLFYDMNWSDTWTSTIGYSQVDIDLDGTAVGDSTFTKGQYALTNIQYRPMPKMMAGAELQWISRNNHNDRYSYDSFRGRMAC